MPTRPPNLPRTPLSAGPSHAAACVPRHPPACQRHPTDSNKIRKRRFRSRNLKLRACSTTKRSPNFYCLYSIDQETDNLLTFWGGCYFPPAFSIVTILLFSTLGALAPRGSVTRQSLCGQIDVTARTDQGQSTGLRIQTCDVCQEGQLLIHEAGAER